MSSGEFGPGERARVKVVHVSSAHPWSDNRVHLREAASLAVAGYDVTLVAVDRDVEVPPTGVNVIKLRRRSRLARFTLGSVEALRQGMRTGAKIFHFHDPELLWAVPLLRLLGKTVIYDAHEDLPSQVRDKHYIPRVFTPLVVGAARMLVVISRFSSHNVAATETIAQRYRPARVTIVHNYPVLRPEEIVAIPLSDRQKAVAYVGALGRERGAVEMVRAAGEDAFPAGWTFNIAGHVVPQSLFDELKELAGWKRVVYFGTVAPHEARDILLASRIGLVLFQANRAHLDSLPTKMFEYMAAGMPVIVSDFPLWRSIVEKFDCGLLVDETSSREIAAAVRRYEDEPDLLELHGNNSRRAAVDFLNWTAEERALVDMYDTLAKKRWITL